MPCEALPRHCKVGAALGPAAIRIFPDVISDPPGMRARLRQGPQRREPWLGRVTGAVLVCFGLVACSPERRFDDVAVVGLAPGPEANQESIVQLYAARSYEWYARIVSVHTWLAFRRAGETKYTVYEAHGFPPYLSGRAVRTCQKYYPDRRWHGAEPTLLAEVRGGRADQAIIEIQGAARRYPDRYRLWPGPNSNSFIAELARAAPELRVDLPPTAIGKDYLVGRRILAPAPSGTGWQISILGLVGILVAREEGHRDQPAGRGVRDRPRSARVQVTDHWPPGVPRGPARRSRRPRQAQPDPARAPLPLTFPWRVPLDTGP